MIPPEVTLQEVEDGLERIEEKERQLEQELERELERQRAAEEERAAGMDGLGTKAVDRDTSFFAQPGVLAGETRWGGRGGAGRGDRCEC